MSDDTELIANMKAASLRLDRAARHQYAIAQSDFLHLVNCLNEAATRFADAALLLEEGSDVIAFLRASAERYKAEAELARGGVKA